MTVKNVSLELYARVDERKKMRVDDFVYPEKVATYRRDEVFRTFKIGYFIVRYQKQKMEIDGEHLTKFVTTIIDFIPRMHGREVYSAKTYSETNEGADLYIHYSSISGIVKMAYLVSEIGMVGFGENSRGNRRDYNTTLEWYDSFMDKEHIIYTKERVIRDKIYYPYFYEGEIALPFEVFFGSLFDQVKNYWRILKVAGFIRESWEKLEEAQSTVDSIRAGLERSEPD